MPFMEVEQPRHRPEPLTGPIRTRAEARLVYAAIIAEMAACDDAETLDCYLLSIGEELIQFAGEMDFLWSGDGRDFLGLEREMQKAHARFATYY